MGDEDEGGGISGFGIRVSSALLSMLTKPAGSEGDGDGEEENSGSNNSLGKGAIEAVEEETIVPVPGPSRSRDEIEEMSESAKVTERLDSFDRLFAEPRATARDPECALAYKKASECVAKNPGDALSCSKLLAEFSRCSSQG
uniref:CHCH domain-containing protein n=1 Tax=Rhodosorus marinus TaxID=101924 RepID=A0A7S3A524_9RHOD|mmetsp:Transcript_44003/g.171799  ORF Transcript_44003/g.171799 Transcript_44003/m.171799 type:complete len:142 (+) Transcript_44003:107-532(+)